MKPRKFSSDEKMSVVLEMLKGGKSVAQICREHALSETIAYRWRDEALNGMKDGLSDKRKARHHTPEAEKERLLKIIGQQAVIIDYQKKISQELSL